MESGIEQPLRQRFVLLRYISGQAGQAALVLLVEDGGGLKIHTEERWEPGLDADEREYLRELMKDWRGARGDRVAAILDELGELSVGPLRAVESGMADTEKLARLMEPFR
jgi:hypothetical protein